MVYSRAWNVSLRPGNHTGLVSINTHQRVVEILKRGVYAPSRVDTTEAFILRGAGACASCGKPMTAGHCKGKTKTYAYFWCAQKGCDQKSKTISRDKMEREFEDLLRTLKPTPWLAQIAEKMLGDCWEREHNEAQRRMMAYREEANEAEGAIQRLGEKLVDCENSRVIAALER